MESSDSVIAEDRCDDLYEKKRPIDSISTIEPSEYLVSLEDDKSKKSFEVGKSEDELLEKVQEICAELVPVPRTNDISAAVSSSSIQSVKHACTTEEDKLIREGVALYAKEGSPNWTAVGKHAGLLGSQAAKRWHDYLHPDHETRKHDAWVQDEVRQLTKLMDETPKQSGGSHAGKTNWLHIANKLNRTKLDCMRKWKQCERALSADTIKKGSFTPEECEVVLRMRDEGKATFQHISKVLNRPANRVGDNYMMQKQRQKKSTLATQGNVAALTSDTLAQQTIDSINNTFNTDPHTGIRLPMAVPGNGVVKAGVGVAPAVWGVVEGLDHDIMHQHVPHISVPTFNQVASNPIESASGDDINGNDIGVSDVETVEGLLTSIGANI